MLIRHQRGAGDDAGVSLVELLVTMTITSTFFAIFLPALASMFTTSRAQQARSSNLDVNRLALTLLDRDLRYANGINVPVVEHGSAYVEWQSGSTTSSGLQQTCHQWRVTAQGRLERRSWRPPLTGTVQPVPSAWETVGQEVRPPAGASLEQVFSLVPPTPDARRQQLSVSFATEHGSPVASTPAELVITGLNTRSTTPPVPAVCSSVDGLLRP